MTKKLGAHWHRKDRRKRCITCGNEFGLSGFYAYPYTTGQGKRSVRYESRCKECSKERCKERSSALPGYYAGKARSWRQANADARKAYQRKYQASEHGKRIKALNQRVRGARQRKNGDNDFRIKELYQQAAAIEAKLSACVDTDDPLSTKMNGDHIMPLSRGGRHTFDNLQILSARQNLQKGTQVQFASAREEGEDA
mgnify:CR=1 FL=1